MSSLAGESSPEADGRRLFAPELSILDDVECARVTGRVVAVRGLVLECSGLPSPVGALCQIRASDGKVRPGEVVGFDRRRALVLTYADPRGIRAGDHVDLVARQELVSVGMGLLGRVLNGRGVPVDGRGDLVGVERMPVFRQAPPALQRKPIREALSTGVRSIDAFTTCGKGQRMGIFAGSGVGKSVLLGMIARHTAAGVVVVCLCGERGREVREFIDRDLGPDGLRRAVVVVTTSDESALLRVKAPFVATAVAEWFRDQGQDVLLLVDSITRLAMAQREIGLSAGEPPATKGYPPSVFAMMPRLLERTGTSSRGSITGVYTVLVEGDDMNEPVSDHVRSILDGHVTLSRDIANRGRFPAVDPLQSVSRLMLDVADDGHRKAAQTLIRLLAAYRDTEDLIRIGAYVKGSSPDVDRAILIHDELEDLLTQLPTDGSSLDETRRRIQELAKPPVSEVAPAAPGPAVTKRPAASPLAALPSPPDGGGGGP